MKKDFKLFIEHMVESIEVIEGYVKDISKNDFVMSLQIQDSIIRRIEIIGEASKNIPMELKKCYSDIP